MRPIPVPLLTLALLVSPGSSKKSEQEHLTPVQASRQGSLSATQLERSSPPSSVSPALNASRACLSSGSTWPAASGRRAASRTSAAAALARSAAWRQARRRRRYLACGCCCAMLLSAARLAAGCALLPGGHLTRDYACSGRQGRQRMWAAAFWRGAGGLPVRCRRYRRRALLHCQRLLPTQHSPGCGGNRGLGRGALEQVWGGTGGAPCWRCSMCR